MKHFFQNKEWCFSFWIIFYRLEILTFLYYANEESDDIINCSTKTVKYWIMNISGNIGVVFFTLGTRNITEETKCHLLCCCYYSGFAAGLVLIKTKIPSFCLNQGSFTRTIYVHMVYKYHMGIMFVFRKDPVPLLLTKSVLIMAK